MALQYYVATQESMLVPRGQTYHKITTLDKDLMKSHRVRVYLDDVNRELFKERYKSQTNFQPQWQDMSKSDAAFGNGALYIDRRNGTNRYKSMFMGETFFQVNFQGVVDTVYRYFSLTAKAPFEQFGDAIPEQVKKQLKDNRFDQDDYVHVVAPNPDHDPNSILSEKAEFIEIYIHKQTQEELQVSGYNVFPYATARNNPAPHEIYGRGPAMEALSQINLVQKMKQLDLRATEIAVIPPILAHDDGLLGDGSQRISLRPAGITYGGLDDNGNQRVAPFISGTRPDISEAKLAAERAQVQKAFLVDLYQILVEQPNMTATEVMQRAQEKAALLVPIVGVKQSETIGPMIEREIDLLERDGVLPPAPPELDEAAEEGSLELEFTYDAPLNRLARQEELAAMDAQVERALALVGATGDPSYLEPFDLDYYQAESAKIRGTPARFAKSPQALEAEREQKAQDQQQQQLAASIPDAAKATLDFARADQIAQGAG
jgi:hypothetical protein